LYQFSNNQINNPFFRGAVEKTSRQGFRAQSIIEKVPEDVAEDVSEEEYL
jgi:hypothetical protein